MEWEENQANESSNSGLAASKSRDKQLLYGLTDSTAVSGKRGDIALMDLWPFCLRFSQEMM